MTLAVVVLFLVFHAFMVVVFQCHRCCRRSRYHHRWMCTGNSQASKSHRTKAHDKPTVSFACKRCVSNQCVSSLVFYHVEVILTGILLITSSFFFHFYYHFENENESNSCFCFIFSQCLLFLLYIFSISEVVFAFSSSPFCKIVKRFTIFC